MTSPAVATPRQRRNKGFDETHQLMIGTAVRLISEKGIDSLSIAELARTMGVNRTTVYYHFASREALLEEVTHWSSEQLAKAFRLEGPLQERIDYITRFVLENPELIKLWIEGFISEGDIRHSYPLWDDLVEGFRGLLGDGVTGAEVDWEVFCVNMLVSAIIGPRVFKNSVCPGADIETVMHRFRAEQLRLLAHHTLLQPLADDHPPAAKPELRPQP
jgi:AcrR family transcriptional regulator